MLITENKILVHFFTNGIRVYKLKNTMLEPLKHEYVNFEELFVTNVLLEKIDSFLERLGQCRETTNTFDYMLRGYFKSLANLTKNS